MNFKMLLAEKADFKVPERGTRKQFINDGNSSYLEMAAVKKKKKSASSFIYDLIGASFIYIKK